MDDAVDLADLIWQLRHDLSRAMWAGEHSDIRFVAESVDLELSVAVERSREPGVKARLWVLDAGTTAKRAATSTQTIRLSMRPIRPDEGDRPAVIGGDTLPGED